MTATGGDRDDDNRPSDGGDEPGGETFPDDRSAPEPEAADQPAEPGHEEPPVRSGLRNPRGAVRALGAGTLLLEALALLLAIVPLQVLDAPPAAVISVVTLAVVAVVLAGFLRYDVTWYLVGGLNIAITLTGYFQWALGALGVVFALVWWYVLHVRRTILGR